MLTVVVSLIFVFLLALEWWRGGRAVRVGTVLFALVVLGFAQPIPYRAMRRTIDLPRAERDTTFGVGGRRLSEYESGVMTMMRMVMVDGEIGAYARAVALGVLVWLAVSPAFRGLRLRASRRGPAGGDPTGPGESGQSPPPEPVA